MFAIAAASLAFVFLAGMIFLIEEQTQLLAVRVASAGVQLSSPLSVNNTRLTASVIAAPSQRPAMLETHIANDGLVLLRGARVTAVSDDIIHVGMVWGSSYFTWAATTGHYTKFLDSKGEKESLSDIAVGDTVTITGRLRANDTEPTIEADFVREK